MTDPWQLFCLDPQTATEKDLKKSYAKLLKANRPDENPQGFRIVYDAYQTALFTIRSAAQSEASALAEQGPIGISQDPLAYRFPFYEVDNNRVTSLKNEDTPLPPVPEQSKEERPYVCLGLSSLACSQRDSSQQTGPRSVDRVSTQLVTLSRGLRSVDGLNVEGASLIASQTKRSKERRDLAQLSSEYSTNYRGVVNEAAKLPQADVEAGLSSGFTPEEFEVFLPLIRQHLRLAKADALPSEAAISQDFQAPKEIITHLLPIHRLGNGKFWNLGDADDMPADSFEGRFAGMLPPKPSDDQTRQMGKKLLDAMGVKVSMLE